MARVNGIIQFYLPKFAWPFDWPIHMKIPSTAPEHTPPSAYRMRHRTKCRRRTTTAAVTVTKNVTNSLSRHTLRDILYVQRRRRHRQQVSDEHRRELGRDLFVDTARTVHLVVPDRHYVVSVRRTELHDEVRLVDVRRQQDQPDRQKRHDQHRHLPAQRRMETARYGRARRFLSEIKLRQVRTSSRTAVYPHMPTYVHTPRDIPRTAHLQRDVYGGGNGVRIYTLGNTSRWWPIGPILGFWESKVPKNGIFPARRPEPPCKV